jgi:hypothetical protein
MCLRNILIRKVDIIHYKTQINSNYLESLFINKQNLKFRLVLLRKCVAVVLDERNVLKKGKFFIYHDQLLLYREYAWKYILYHVLLFIL